MKILITGASRGVGRAIAIKCAESGSFERIIINAYKNSASLSETAEKIKKNPKKIILLIISKKQIL